MRSAGAFDEKTLHQIAGRPYFLLVLTEGTLDRCVNDGDWLRLEIEHAVATNRMIVPLIIQPFDIGECARFLPPTEAEAIRTANGVGLQPEFFNAAIERLVNDRLVPIELPVAAMSASDERYAQAAQDLAKALPAPVPVVPTPAPAITDAIAPPPPELDDTAPVDAVPAAPAEHPAPPATPARRSSIDDTVRQPAPAAPTADSSSAPDPEWWRRPAVLGGVGLALLAVVIIGVAIAQSGDEPQRASLTPPSGSRPEVATTLDDRSTTQPTTTQPATTPAPTAREQLDQLVVTDATAVANVAEFWVPQLSAKEFGTEWRGVTYDYEAILAEHLGLRDRHGAVLVDGGTYNFRMNEQPMSGWYITIVPEAFLADDDALAWCTQQELPRDDCFARLISTRLDIESTTKFNP